MAKSYEAVLEEALQAARNLGMAEREINTIRKALRPLTPAELAEIRRCHTERQRLNAQRDELRRMWDSMSFAEWGRLRAAGKLPPTEF